MNKALIIARREYKEVLRTKIFWISMLLPILIMVIAVVMGVRHMGSMNKMNQRDLAALRAMVRAMGAFVYLFVMFMSMLTPSQMLMTSLIEEKSSRVVEVLLSAVSPLELMAGKILGLFAVGLTIALVFVLAMVPMIQSGCGLNFGLSIGIIAGLLGATLSVQMGFVGLAGFFAAIVLAAPFAVPKPRNRRRLKPASTASSREQAPVRCTGA
jgi:ABC-type Na+ efflux pump permease subunit